MISRSDWEPLPTPTLSPFARGYLSLCRFFTAAVRCVPALRVPLVHSLINHFRQNESTTTRGARGLRRHTRAPEKKNPKKKISEIRVSKLVRHYTTIEGMHSSPRTQTPTTEPARRETTTAVGTGRPRP